MRSNFNNYNTSKALGFSNVYKILQKFQTTSEKKISSRIIRKSTVTNSVKGNCTYKDRLHLAKSMSHNMSTADVHYDRINKKDSVLHRLSKRKEIQSVSNSGVAVEEIPISSRPPSMSSFISPSTNSSISAKIHVSKTSYNCTSMEPSTSTGFRSSIPANQTSTPMPRRRHENVITNESDTNNS